jgi:hypothetical protein
VRQEAQMATVHQSLKRDGVIQNYDPVRGAVRVLIQPEGILTGYIPLTSPWVGNGWGMVCGPSIGDVVEIDFLQGSKDSGVAGNRYFNAQCKPPPAPSGEFWLVHKSGSFIKLTNDGDIILSAARKLVQHGTTMAAEDAGGTGVKYEPDLVSTYTDGVDTAHSGPNPPEIPA